MIRRRSRFRSRPCASAAATISSITPSPRCRSSSPSRTKSGSQPSAATLPSLRTSAGAVTTGRQNTASSPADGTAFPTVTVFPPRTSRSAARTTTVPAGVPATGTSAGPIASAAERRQDCTRDSCDRRGFDTQRLPGVPPCLQTSTKTQVTALCGPARLKYVVLRRVWALDADLAAAFDRIDHAHLLQAIGGFPARGMIAEWLKAGVFEPGKGFAPTEEGTPQGGVISPLLLNVALHGLEEAAGVRYSGTGVNAGRTIPGSPVLVRYADDMVVLCHNQGQAEQVKARLAEWLAPRGLVFNGDKTKIVSLGQGFDFLGFNVRRYNRKLLIKPGKAALKRLRNRLAAEMRILRGSNVMAVLAKLGPIIRGWAAYYRGVVSSRLFSSLDHYLWQLLYKWATWSHANKPKSWIVDRYFAKFNKFRNDRWVFGRDSDTFLVKLSWTDIVRHAMVKGAASPDDPALAGYWAERREKVKPPLDKNTLRLLTRQDARCPLCAEHLLTADQPPQSPEQWERWWLQVTRKAIVADYLMHHGGPGSQDGNQTRLVHPSCYRGLKARQRKESAQRTCTPQRLAGAVCRDEWHARF